MSDLALAILGSSLLTSVASAVVSAVFSRRKTLSDITSTDTKTIETAVKMLREQADSYHSHNKELSEQNDKLEITNATQSDQLRKHRYAAEINDLHAKRGGNKLRVSPNEFDSLSLQEIRELHRDISNG